MDEKAEERRAFVKYLDYRIPQLHEKGKVKPGPTPEGTPLHERIEVCRRNAESSHYPGVAARHKAEQEFMQGARAPE